MTTVKLTSTRRRVLEAARDGDLYRLGSNGHCFIDGGHFAQVTGVVTWLVNNGLIRSGSYDRYSGRWSWVITDAGRAALDAS